MTDRKQHPDVNLRELVLLILLEVEAGQNSNQVLKDVLDKYRYLPRRDRAFVTRLTEGTLEYRIRLDDMIDRFSTVPVKKQKPVIREILRTGAYQLMFMDSVPARAVCSEAVKLAEKKGFRGLKGFVNGVLRTMSGEWEKIDRPYPEEQPVKALSLKYSMPEWIVEDWLQVYDRQQVEKMLQAFLTVSPVTVRCRCGEDGVKECMEELQREQVQVRRHPYLPCALEICGFDRLEALETFRKGRIIVQDVSSMLAGRIAGAKPGDVILDVCAAPGGKSFYLADQLEGTGSVTARDISEKKTALIRENQNRLGIRNLTVQVWDACVLDEAFVEKADIVVADVPCSGLGVLAKKKEIKYRMSREQQKELVGLQRRILDTVWRYVKPGGVLIYSTCTINTEENEKNVEWFLAQHPFIGESIEEYLCGELKGSPGVSEGRLQLLPGIHKCDGFFMARLRRKQTGKHHLGTELV